MLGLTILPTVSCNPRCPYCFEQTKPTGMMSDDTIEKLIRFIKANAVTGRYAITWFGGEPLLEIPVMDKILDKLSEDKDLTLTDHSIITNGTLLNQEAVRLFRKYPLNSMQITFDGTRDSHNSKRFFEGGTVSFDIILKNLSVFLEEIPKIHIDVRVNIDNNNKEEYIAIHKLITEKFSGLDVVPYPAILRANRGCEDETFLTSDQHLEFSTSLWRANIRHSMYPSRCSKGCCATSISSHVIGPEGELYVCWEHAGNKDKILGYIDGRRGSATDRYASYMLRGNCFEDHRYLDCSHLPPAISIFQRRINPQAPHRIR